MGRNSTTPQEWFVASEAGLPRYFDPRPCGRGHVGERWTTNMGCIACRKLANKAKRAPVVRRSTGFGESVSLVLTARPDDVHYLRICAALLAGERGETLRTFLKHHGKGLQAARAWTIAEIVT